MTQERKPRGVPLWGALVMLGLGILAGFTTFDAIRNHDTLRIVVGCLMLAGAVVYIAGYLVTLRESS